MKTELEIRDDIKAAEKTLQHARFDLAELLLSSFRHSSAAISKDELEQLRKVTLFAKVQCQQILQTLDQQLNDTVPEDKIESAIDKMIKETEK